MGNTTELEREVAVPSENKPAEAPPPSLSKAEEGVLLRLRRARLIASLAAPEVKPTMEDLVEIAEMVEDAGG